jgi:thiaminase
MNIDHLQDRIAPLRAQLIEHQVYQQIATEVELKAFTEEHVFAVWDFMSLLKSLQQHLTCVQVPWMPTKNKETRRFINEIVVGEESDFDANGKTMSHFEMYLQAMQSMGANTQEMGRFIELISNQVPIEEALDACMINPETKAFVRFTFSIIQRGKIHEIASVFTFGREDLIPEMFIEMVKELKANHQSALDDFLFYLERHIEVDGEDHGPLSLKLMDEVCVGDPAKWEEATQVAEEALRMRIHLWDGVVRKASTLLHGI